MTQSTKTTEKSANPKQEAPEQPSKPVKRRWRPTRRGFLIGAGATGALLALGVRIGAPIARRQLYENIDNAEVSFGAVDDNPQFWFEVLPDSRIQLFIPKSEMGQGVHTAVTQIAAEELGVGWTDIHVVQASSAQAAPGTSMTGGSGSVTALYTPLRQAAATLRELLRQEAALVLDQEADALTIQERAFVVTHAPERRVALSALAANKSEWEVPEEPIALKAESDFEFIGKSLPRVDIPAKVTGEALYGYDMRVAGMRYGVVARPPTVEAKLRSAWPMQAGEMPGVEAVVIEKDFVGVVAQSRAEARAALGAMRISWHEGRLWQQEEIDRAVTVGNGSGTVIQRKGNTPNLSENTFSAEYRTPFAVQSPLEPQAALADVRGDSARIWVSTQASEGTRDGVAAAMEMDAAKIEVIPAYLGGGFGRKLGAHDGAGVALEAAKLSKAAGMPVHVGWDRPEEMRHGYFRPPTHNRLSASFNPLNQITDMEHQQASGEVAFPFLPGFLKTVLGSDFGSWRGSHIRYNVPNREVVAWLQELPVSTGWWRGLGLIANTFAVESFMDESAHFLGVDPLAFRLAHMPDDQWGERMGAVLRAAAEKADWGGTLPEGHAHGIACSTDVDTVVAQVAEVSVDRESGKIRVHKVTCAMDCGKTVSPNGAEAQIQGSVMWGVGTALIEQVRVKDGRVDINNFDSYPLLTMREAPHVETVLLEAGDGQPRGVGEPPMGPVAAAIGNGFFALTGKRLRELPMTPERVLAVLG